MVWLPSLITKVSMLSTVAVISTSTDCSADNLTVSICSSALLSSCISSLLLSYTETYLSGLAPCTVYTVYITPTNQPADILWTEQSQTKVSLELNITLEYTTGTISTYYKSSCMISSNLRSVSLCPMRQPGMEFCRHFSVHPDKLETTAMVEDLLPCTQYVVRWVSQTLPYFALLDCFVVWFGLAV